MLKLLAHFITFIGLITSSSIAYAECYQSLEFDVGWRRDYLDWDITDLRSSYFHGHSDSHIKFKSIDSYTLTAKAKWYDASYYIRASAEYGLSATGKAREHFYINSPDLFYPIFVDTHNNPVKRRSEVYDFNGAIGYPFSFCCCRLVVIPLIGFSYHRQHLRVKSPDNYLSCCYSDSSGNPCDSSCSSSSFSVKSSNPFYYYESSNPFSSSSYEKYHDIPYELGLSNCHRTSRYLFTWYGFYLGADIAYTLDKCWTIYTELEGHFLDHCHRQRKSWTGVSSVDDYKHKSGAYGFNGIVGIYYNMTTCWYTDLLVEYKWWKSDSKDDDLHWDTVGVKLGVGYTF